MNVNEIAEKFKETDNGKKILEKALAAATELVFDLKSGPLNKDISEVASPSDIGKAVLLKSSLTVIFNDTEFELKPYYSELSEESAINLLIDAKASFESSMINTALMPQQ